MANGWSEEVPGTGGGTSADPFLRRRRLALEMGEADDTSDVSYLTGANSGGGGGTGADRLTHRIMDDQQTGNRSGGPAGGYQDPGVDRLAELRASRERLNQPAPKVPLWKSMLTEGARLAPVIAASLSGQPGATVGAERGYEEGVQRRHQLSDVAATRQTAERQRLDEAIEAEERGREQRTFTHGEDLLRQQTAEEGLTTRAGIAERSQQAQTERLAQVIAGQGQRQERGIEGQKELEGIRQTGRMTLQDAKNRGTQAVARIRAAQAAQHRIPPMVAKAADDFENSQSRADIMSQNLEAGMRGDQQAQLSLLANHLGMTMGLAKGARISHAIIREAESSAPWLGRIEARFDDRGYLSGVVLTPEQMQLMVDLGNNRLLEDARKAQWMESYFGVQGGVPIKPRVPPNKKAGEGADRGANGAGATGATTSAPKTAEEYLKRKRGGGG